MKYVSVREEKREDGRMQAKFEVKMTTRTMYRFLLNHTYHSPSGFIAAALGMGALGICAYTYGGVEGWQTTLYGAFGIWFLIYLPVSLYLKAARQVRLNPVYRKPLEYRIDDQGIATRQEGKHAEIKWGAVFKVRESRESLLIYTAKSYCFVLPKKAMGGQTGQVLSLIRKHMKPEKVKLYEIRNK